jgi:hypothetical protein
MLLGVLGRNNAALIMLDEMLPLAQKSKHNEQWEEHKGEKNRKKTRLPKRSKANTSKLNYIGKSLADYGGSSSFESFPIIGKRHSGARMGAVLEEETQLVLATSRVSSLTSQWSDVKDTAGCNYVNCDPADDDGYMSVADIQINRCVTGLVQC